MHSKLLQAFFRVSRIRNKIPLEEMFLSTNGKLVAAVPAKALLKLNPDGVYTGCRTVGRTRIAEFEKHVERIGIR